MTICWEHPENTKDDFEGLNDAAMGHFRGSPLPSYVREGLQNSLDAKSKSSGSEPVKIKIALRNVAVNSIPNVDQLRVNIKGALECNEIANGAKKGTPTYLKLVKHHEKSLKLLSQNEIPVLQISDSNTKGMSWGNKTSDFFTYMKAINHNQKNAEEGGSHGVGKMATFVISQLRTVFASSVYEVDGELQQATMGKTFLSSVTNKDNILRHAVGYWGENDKYGPVHTNELVESNWMYKSTSSKLEAKNIGTLISSIGFDVTQNPTWDYEIASSIIMNYFAAIHSNKLDIEVGDKIHINANSLKVFFKQDGSFVKKMKIIKGENAQFWEKKFDLARDYASLLEQDTEVKKSTKELPTLGMCQLKLKLGDYDKKVCYIRNGMKITDDPKLDRVSKFQGLMGFVAIFECLDSKGNTILRSMENIAHDKFSVSIVEDHKENKRAQLAIYEMTNWIRDELNNHAKRKGEDVEDIQEFLEFFKSENDEKDGDGDKSKNEINPFGKPVEIKLKPIRPPKLPQITGYNPAGGGGHKPSSKFISMPVSNFRFTIAEDSKNIKLFFTPEFSNIATISLYKSDADNHSDVLKIGQFLDGNENTRYYEEGKRVQIDIILESDFYGSLEIALASPKGEIE